MIGIPGKVQSLPRERGKPPMQGEPFPRVTHCSAGVTIVTMSHRFIATAKLPVAQRLKQEELRRSFERRI
jgi:hypothetical protein